MKVDKAQFDALLKRMIDTQPEKTKAIKGKPGTLKSIVPPSQK
jgi:hypothetical protein